MECPVTLPIYLRGKNIITHISKMSRAELEAAFKALQEAYAELRERYNNEKVNTGRYDHAIF